MSFNPDAMATGIYSKLTGYAPLMSLITGVYRIFAPDGTAFPYVNFKMIMSFPEDQFDTYYTRSTWQFDCWARDVEGTTTAVKLASEVANQLTACLDGATDIVVPDHTFIYSKRDMMQTLDDIDVEAVRILVQYRFLVGVAR